MPENILVLLETERDALKKVSLETLCLAKKLADSTGQTPAAILTCRAPQSLTDTAARHGAEIIYLPENEGISLHDTDSHVSLLETIIKESGTSSLLMGDTPLGKEIAPRLAVRLKAGLISGCSDIVPEGSSLAGRRLIMNGKAQAAVKIRRSDICIATISPGYADVREFPVKKPPEIRQLYYLKGEKPAVEFVEYIKGDPAAVSLNEAEIILAVGNGLGDPERLEIIRELAGLLGASLGATRVAVDHKWMPPERQIGITGLTVSPRLFISCGISGQYPHTVGMDSSETIIVINKDREAPMFKLATLGIVGTLEEIVPALSAHLKSLLESSKERIS